MIQINAQTAIPESELVFSASRSGGPGGQNVNKLSTRVTLQFDVRHSRALTDEQKKLIEKRLSNRISKDGLLRVVSQEYRTQGANRRAALEKFSALLASALRKKKVRHRSVVSAAEKLRRLEEKRRRSQIKRRRSTPPSEDF